MFIKVTDIDGDVMIVNTDKIEAVAVSEENELSLWLPDDSYIYIKGNLDEFYQRLVKADRKDQH